MYEVNSLAQTIDVRPVNNICPDKDVTLTITAMDIQFEDKESVFIQKDIDKRAREYGITVFSASSSIDVYSENSDHYGTAFELELTSRVEGEEPDTWFNKTRIKIVYQKPACP